MASIKCGNCKGTHDSVNEVRACYAGQRTSVANSPTQTVIPVQGDPTANVPAGYYATPSLTGNNDLDFWKVDRPTEGRWSGYTFVKRVIGGHDDARLPADSKKRIGRDDTERVAHVTQKTALRAIVAYGIEASAQLFGTELKYCGTCGIHLTDETSRALGIGPVCRDK